MGEFFRGWRRKVGCAALVASAIFAADWIHSRYGLNCIQFAIQGRYHQIISTRESISWAASDAAPDNILSSLRPISTWARIGVRWVSFIEGKSSRTEFWRLLFSDRVIYHEDHKQQFEQFAREGYTCVLLADTDDDLNPFGKWGRHWKVDHWQIVSPLTALSACLVLWRPRKRSTTV